MSGLNVNEVKDVLNEFSGVTDTSACFIESAGRTAQVMNIDKSGAIGQNIDIRLCQDPNHKCNTANFIKLGITDKKTFSRLIGRWYRLSETGFDSVISPEDTFLIGKTIYLRSPITCEDHGEGICRYCYGELYFTNKNINVGKYAAEELTQRLLSTKFLLDTNIDKTNFPDIFKSYFTFDDNAVTTSFTKDEIVQELNSTIIKSGIDLMSVHLEVLLSNQIRSISDILEKPREVRYALVYQEGEEPKE